MLASRGQLPATRERPQTLRGSWCTGGTRKPSLVNPVRQLDASERYRCISERLEARHGRAAAFDRAMILLNDVVQVGAVPHENILPLRILPAQKPQRLMTRRVPVERNLARPARQAGGQCLAEECLCRRNASIGSEQKVDGLAPLVDGTVEVVPLSMH